MSLMKKLAKSSSHYFLGESLAMLSLLISFPIFARIFTKSEYGLLNLVAVTLTFMDIIISGGLKPAVIRFYGECKQDGEEKLRLLYSTMITTTLATGCVGAILLLLINQIGIVDFLGKNFGELIKFISVLLIFRIGSGMIRAFLQCEEKTVLYNVTLVLERYLGLVISLFFVLSMNLGLQGFYYGKVLSEGLFFFYLLAVMLRRPIFKIGVFSKTLLINNIKYGFPLCAYNIAGFINNSGDRYLIQYFLGSEKVGVYSLGYNMAFYIKSLVVTSINSALIPMTMNLWAKEGSDKTGKFLSKFLGYYAMFAIPIIFGLSVMARDAVVVLGSTKYIESAEIVFYVITGTMISGAYFPIVGGLFIQKKTLTLAQLLITASIINIILNIILIPLIGIKGAAIATLISCVFFIIIGNIKASQHIKTEIPYAMLFRYVIYSTVMSVPLYLLSLPFVHNIVIALVIKITIGIIIYILCLFVHDPLFEELVSGLPHGQKILSVKYFLRKKKLTDKQHEY